MQGIADTLMGCSMPVQVIGQRSHVRWLKTKNLFLEFIEVEAIPLEKRGGLSLFG